MTKFRQAVDEMIQEHQKDFDEFTHIHSLYKQDQEKWQDEFDRIGKPLVRIIEQTENRLCSKMENGGKGKYSATLAEKFRAELKKIYPLIDFVGVKIS